MFKHGKFILLLYIPSRINHGHKLPKLVTHATHPQQQTRMSDSKQDSTYHSPPEYTRTTYVDYSCLFQECVRAEVIKAERIIRILPLFSPSVQTF